MEKMKMHSPNMTSENIKKIAEMFPNCVTETDDGKGGVKNAVNFDMLKQMLSEDIAEGDESYEFTWVGKKAAIVEANKPIRKTLRPCKEESVDWDNTENLYIEGDNLEVLKLLQESYLGKVKMIYIDPPYNTGSDFIYNDDFKMTEAEYADEARELDADGNKMFKNTDSNGRFHSDWCSMIYSRLMLARNLLSDDGVIFISIDDNEQQNMKNITNEIFGEENFIACFCISSNSSKNNARFVSISHEYMICYAKTKINLHSNWQVKKSGVDEFQNRAKQLVKRGLSKEQIHNELLELVKYPRFYELDHYTYADERGIYQTNDPGGVPNGNKTTEIIHPLTGKPCTKPSSGWRYKDEEIRRKLENNEFEFGEDEKIIPRPKRYIKDFVYSVPKSIAFFDSQGSTKWLKSEKIPFDFPKAVDFIKWTITMYPEKDFIALDFFSGSATTAHAVMQLNTEDGGNRKFIMVQLPETTDEKSEAYKAGYKNICEIGKERIRRAGAKIKEENPNAINLDTGFRVLKLDETNMTDVYYSPLEINQQMLIDQVDNIKADRTDMDLLFGCLLDWGVPLNLPYVSENIDGCTVHTYNDGDLIACFDKNIPESVVKAIAKRQPLRAVFRDSSFENSPAKINVGEIFKMMAPDTRVRVI